jgi:hypothetical protein
MITSQLVMPISKSKVEKSGFILDNISKWSLKIREAAELLSLYVLLDL